MPVHKKYKDMKLLKECVMPMLAIAILPLGACSVANKKTDKNQEVKKEDCSTRVGGIYLGGVGKRSGQG